MARAPRRIDEDEVDDDETMRLMDEGMMVDEGSLGSYVTVSLLLLPVLVRPRTTALATTAPAGTTTRRPLLPLYYSHYYYYY